MPLKWKIFRVICIIQMLASSVFAIISLTNLFRLGGIAIILQFIVFTLAFLLTIFTNNLLNNNYPDTPVAGTQKTNFNRLFLLNFISLVVLFGIVFADYRQLQDFRNIVLRPLTTLPFDLFIPLLTSLSFLILQLIMLYGLYDLRRELYLNFTRKKFEFEQPGSSH